MTSDKLYILGYPRCSSLTGVLMGPLWQDCCEGPTALCGGLSAESAVDPVYEPPDVSATLLWACALWGAFRDDYGWQANT